MNLPTGCLITTIWALCPQHQTHQPIRLAIDREGYTYCVIVGPQGRYWHPVLLHEELKAQAEARVAHDSRFPKKLLRW